MEQTFMTIHNLGPDANILFASESIADILGYQQADVQGKSCFDYFHPEEEPFARSVHSRGVLLDKAASLHYVRIKSREGRWIGCECCFTIVHDVLVACTSIYRRNAKSERRAIEAPQIRRIFSCSPRDPRYHMLEHLSPKFKMLPMEREPRAALILNRFTRNLTIMFATTALTAVTGLRPSDIKNKSFYRCIQEGCLPEALKCLESAKANDSIAYLRFCFQDPREEDEISTQMAGADCEDDEDDGDEETGKCAHLHQRRKGPYHAPDADAMDIDSAVDVDNLLRINIDESERTTLSGLSLPTFSTSTANNINHRGALARLPPIELEAVVSCTSDGLVVVLRKARPPIPPAHPPLITLDYEDGLFAALWGQNPIKHPFLHESHHSFQPLLQPQYMSPREHAKDTGGPPLDELMSSIRDVAVFAWGVVGINPAMAAYGRGLPSGEARPASSTRPAHRRCASSTEDENSGNDSHASSPSSTSSTPCFPERSLEKGKREAFSMLERYQRQPTMLLPASSSSDGMWRDDPEMLAYGACSLQSSWARHGWDAFPGRQESYRGAYYSERTRSFRQRTQNYEAPPPTSTESFHSSSRCSFIPRNSGC